jgi:hypothetical protein
MPLLKYFLAVGTVLTFGLFALSAYLEPVPVQGPVRLSVAPTTATLVPLAPTPKKAR